MNFNGLPVVLDVERAPKLNHFKKLKPIRTLAQLDTPSNRMLRHSDHSAQ